jgi:hypothetical protein
MSKYLNTLIILPIGTDPSPESKLYGCAELNVGLDLIRFPQTCSQTSLSIQWSRKKNNSLQLKLYDLDGKEMASMCIQACEFRWKCIVPADQLPVDLNNCNQKLPVVCTSTTYIKVLQLNALNVQLVTDYCVFEKAAYDYLGVSISTHNLLTDAETRTSIIQNYVYNYNLIFNIFCAIVNFFKSTELLCIEIWDCIWKQVSGLNTLMDKPLLDQLILFNNTMFEDFLKMRLVGIMALCNAGKNLLPIPTSCPVQPLNVSMAPQLLNTLIVIPIGPTGSNRFPENEPSGCAQLDIGLDQVHFPLTGQQVTANPLYPRVSQKPLLVSWKKINHSLELTLYDPSGCIIGKLTVPEGEYFWRCIDDCQNLEPVACGSAPTIDGLLGYDKVLQINVLNEQLLADYVQFEAFAYYTLFSTINIHNYLGEAERQTDLIQKIITNNQLITNLFATLIQLSIQSELDCFPQFTTYWNNNGLNLIYGPLTKELIQSASNFNQVLYQDFLKMRTIGLLDLCNCGLASTIPVRIQNSNFCVEKAYGCSKPGLTQLFSQNKKK